MSNTISNSIRENIRDRVALNALGNRKRDLKAVAIDLINASGQDWGEIAAGCYLCKATIKNLATENTRFPRADTLERIFRYFEYDVTLGEVRLKGQYRNQPKE